MLLGIHPHPDSLPRQGPHGTGTAQHWVGVILFHYFAELNTVPGMSP